jgi:hypothetical protein
MNRAALEYSQTFSTRLIFSRYTAIAALVLLTALSMSEVAAQSDAIITDDEPNAAAEPIEEITVVGERLLRDLRLDVQVARENVYGLFNSLNTNEEFDIHCHDGARTGTRMVQRVCRPQFTDDATGAAAKWYQRFRKLGGWGSGFQMAQAEMAVVPLKERQLAAEVQRLAHENREFRRAISEYQAVEQRYEEARRGTVIKAAASIVDTSRPRPPGNEARHSTIAVPQPIELATPVMPPSASESRVPQEGWVKLRYSVLADGTTADVRAVDAMPTGLDPSGAVTATKAWKFEPAREGSVPIDWHNNMAFVVFSRADAVHDGSIEFAEAYEEVAELISSGRLEDAKSRNEQMQSQYAVTFEEIEIALMQLAAIEHALGDRYAALTSIRRATEPAIAKLAPDELKLALEHRFALEIELGLASDALQTYGRRAELERLAPREPLARQGAALEQALAASDAAQAVQGRIAANGLWEYAVPWATFEVTDVDGRADSVLLECHRRKTELPFQPNVQMTIPVSWGGCVVTLRGQPETTFTFYDFRAPAR